MALQLPESSQKKLALSIDLRIVVLVLLLVIVGMLAAWRPWSSAKTSDRTIEVTGEATVTAEPDEFVFYPSYEFKGGDKAAALAGISQKSKEVVAKLKALGVPDSGIKTNTSGYDLPTYSREAGNELTYTLQLTVTAGDLELAQKVQDYLVSTAPTGNVSPQASFSDKKRKQLESQARDEAAKDARVKADQMAKNVGFKVGKVKTVNDGQGFGAMPFRGGAVALDAKAAAEPNLDVQPGENDLPYSVTVVYYIR